MIGVIRTVGYVHKGNVPTFVRRVTFVGTYRIRSYIVPYVTPPSHTQTLGGG